MDVTTVEIATSQKEIINPLGDFGCCYADSTGLVLHCAWLKKIYGCSCFCWSKIVLSGWWLKTVLFCHLHTLSWFCFFSHVTCLFVEVSSFTRMENSQKKLRDVRIFQVFTWAPFRLWWLMSLPTYKNIDIRYINKMIFFAMPGYILQLMGCYLADLVDYSSKSWILGCMSEYMSVRCASHLGKDARPCWKLKQKMFENRIMKNRFWLFLDI